MTDRADREETFIRQCAARGLSQQATAELLGTTRYKLRLFLVRRPDIKFQPGGHSRIKNESLAEYNRARAGTTHEWQREGAAKGRAVMRERALREAFGVKGTLPELCKRFGVVAIATVRQRLDGGMGLEDALITPRRKNTEKQREIYDYWRFIREMDYRNYTERRAQ